MLSFSAPVLQALAHQREEQFVLRLVALLQAQFPALLAPLPAFVRITAVCNGLDHAHAWGFTQERTLGMFVALQCETAPDFFRSQHVQPWLRAPGEEHERLTRMVQQVPADVWSGIQRGADTDAWFEPLREQQRAARIAWPVCQALPELVAHHAEPLLQRFFAGMAERGLRHGLQADADLAVLAAALAFYGDGLDGPRGPAWAAPLFLRSAPPPPPALVATLRQALVLDSGRLV